MSDLLFARAQMGFSLAFHIIFAVVGIALPLMMVIAEWLWIRNGDDTSLQLAKRWAKGTTVLFAVGAVSGTVLSFELGLLWPKFMDWSGAIIGLPFALEGFAFFTEAIFLGIYLYGWNKVSRWAHLGSGIIVSISGALSAIFVVTANAWMNAPTGFELQNGMPANIDPIVAMMSPAALPEVIHMLIASYASVGFLVAGIHAFVLLREKQSPFHRRALGISLILGCSMSILMPLSGDHLAKMVAETQPIKLAALEGQFETEKGAPLRIGGLPNVKSRETPFAIEIPRALSWLAYGDADSTVKGLKDFPEENWPPVLPVHLFFQIMVGCGTILTLVSLWAAVVFARTRSLPDSDLFLKVVIAVSPLGIIAIESGWMVTELGRQPWVITGVLRTADAVTPMPGLMAPFLTFLFVYVFLFAMVVWLLVREVSESPDGPESQKKNGKKQEDSLSSEPGDAKSSLESNDAQGLDDHA